MPRRPLISAKLPPELHAAVTAKMQETGATQSEAVIAALSAWVGLPSPDRDSRLAALEQRVQQLEQQSTPSSSVNPFTAAIPNPSDTEQRSTLSPPVYPVRPAKPPAAAPIELTQATGSTVEADGVRWLTTSQGFAVASQRGCDRSFDAFRSWSKRNPAECLAQYQLRHISHGTRSNTAASFEDLGAG
jgi:hypothetical protein